MGGKESNQNKRYDQLLPQYLMNLFNTLLHEGAQWLSGRDREAAGSSLTGISALWPLNLYFTT